MPTIFILILVLLASTKFAHQLQSVTPRSEIDQCRQNLQRTETPLETLAGLVGIGWDDIRQVPAAPVLASTFSQCRTTPDNLYLLPDQVEAIPTKKKHLDRTANHYENYHDYLKVTSNSISLEAGVRYAVFSISASFSKENIEIKQKFFADKSTLLHTRLEYHAYFLTNTDSRLHPAFIARLMDIYDALKSNLTRRAKYDAQMVIREFGTHVVRSTDAGALIEQEDYIDSSVKFDRSSSLDRMKAAASASFFTGIFGASAGASIESSVNVTEVEQFKSILKHSQIRTRGGPRVNEMLFAASRNSNGAQPPLPVTELVALDRTGEPLYTAISEHVLEIEKPYLDTIIELIKNATEEYYTQNTVAGCMDPLAPNFSYQANSNDTSCDTQYNNFTFGGIYQICMSYKKVFIFAWQNESCGDQINGETGNTSCPPNYDAIPVFNRFHQFPDKRESACVAQSSLCYTVVRQAKARLQAFWCRAKSNIAVESNKGFMFGGLYSNDKMNPLTGARSCPGTYRPYQLSWDVTVCLSRDYQVDGQFSIPFGGFFSCETPEADRKCPHGYSQHLASTISGCDVYYCVRPEVFQRYDRPVVKRPPFDDFSAFTSNDTTSTVYVYANDSTFLFKKPLAEILEEQADKYERLETVMQGLPSSQISEETALQQWITQLRVSDFMHLASTQKTSSTNPATMSISTTETSFEHSNDQNSGGLSTVWIIAIVVVSLLLVCAVILVIWFYWRPRSAGHRGIY